MKIIGALIVLFFLVFGMFCVWAGCEASIELIMSEGVPRAELGMYWMLVFTLFICGMLSFAVCPMIINEL